MKIVHSDTPIAAASKALADLLQANSQPTLCLLAGGSWLQVYQVLPTEIFRVGQTYMCGDERYSPDSAVNNFEQLVAAGVVARARRRGAVVIETKVLEGETHAAYAARLARAYADWRQANPTGRVIATFGLGEDGHTAGIFAASAAAAADAAPTFLSVTLAAEQNPYQERVTPSASFLMSEVEAAVVMVVGSAKCPRLKQVLAAENYHPELPATLWAQLPAVSIVTDCSV